MEKKTTIYPALALMLAFASCSQEGPADALRIDGNRIYFRSYLPTVSETRAGVISNDNLSECRVTAFNPDDDSRIEPETGRIPAYFTNHRFARDGEGRFVGENADTCMWPDSRSRLHFFAYHPSAESMKGNIDGNGFNLSNNSVKTDASTVIDYWLNDFKVAADIADQVDFISAYSSGTQQENQDGGISLNFGHRLARIELSAWGASAKYDFEIAGVRIGNAVTEGDFSFSSMMPGAAGDVAWINTGHGVVEHIFSPGESTVIISRQNAAQASADRAASIMGSAGPAMVIPMAERIEKWEGKNDPAINGAGYTTDRLYFSILLRVRNQDDRIVYPYPNDRDGIPVVYLAVDRNGSVIRRVFRFGDEYYTGKTEGEGDRYVPGANEEIRGFCWATVPVGAKWDAGKIYTYKLNYTNGIGWQDPSDPNPGEPIIERGMVPFEVNVEEWVEAENHDPNLEVPKR